ncbi:MAG TPA: ester cyclase [Gaiellaceae bacterium]|jgi:predicted ester cyclase|nr:ester cyclase [Gaiellaceae bacterium]
MGEARDVMDRLTDAVMGGRADEVSNLYADNATVMTPDAGEVRGRDAISAYFNQFSQGFPDASWEPLSKVESGNTAIDEGYFLGTHTGPLATPTGETIPPTGKRVRLRECDVATVENGRIMSHRFYFDQMEFLQQLGLAPEA